MIKIQLKNINMIVSLQLKHAIQRLFSYFL